MKLNNADKGRVKGVLFAESEFVHYVDLSNRDTKAKEIRKESEFKCYMANRNLAVLDFVEWTDSYDDKDALKFDHDTLYIKVEEISKDPSELWGWVSELLSHKIDVHMMTSDGACVYILPEGKGNCRVVAEARGLAGPALIMKCEDLICSDALDGIIEIGGDKGYALITKRRDW